MTWFHLNMLTTLNHNIYSVYQTFLLLILTYLLSSSSTQTVRGKLFTSNRTFQDIFPLANSFAKWENVRRWQAHYGTQMRKIRATLGGACARP